MLGVLLIVIFAVLSGFLPYDIFTYEQWATFLAFTVFLFVLLMMILMPTAYLN